MGDDPCRFCMCFVGHHGGPPAYACLLEVKFVKGAMNRKQSKFTVIELLVMIAIIAMLMGILVAALGRMRKQARKTACMSNVRFFALALGVYAADHDDQIIAPHFRDEREFWTEKFHGFCRAGDLKPCSEAVEPNSLEVEFVHGSLAGRCNCGAPYRVWYDMWSTEDDTGKIFLGS